MNPENARHPGKDNEECNGSCMQGLGLAPVLCEHLEAMNFNAPTRIQQATLPVLLVGYPPATPPLRILSFIVLYAWTLHCPVSMHSSVYNAIPHVYACMRAYILAQKPHTTPRSQ